MKAVAVHKLFIVAVVFITAILFCHNLITGKYYWTNFRAFGETEVETSFNQIGEFNKYVFNKNITQRGKWQQKQMEEYCSHYHQKTERVDWDRMLYEDKHKVIYCSVPKTGCTTMKTMMVLLQGLFTLDQLNKTKVTHWEHLGKAFKLCRVNSIRPCYQPKNNTDYLLKNYYKFVVVRDPLERFVSAYHNKFASKDSESVYQNLQKQILQTYRNNNAEFPSFSEFVGYVFHTKLHSSDRHLIPVTGLCGPCQIKYDFYVNFRILKEDVGSLLQLLNIPQEYFFNNIKHRESLMPKSIHYNSSIIIDHFNQLIPDQRMTFFKEFSNELEFYEAIFPGDLDIYHSAFNEFNHSNYESFPSTSPSLMGTLF